MSDPTLPSPSPSLPDLVQRYLDGESIQSLAAESKTCRQTIYNWLLANTDPHYEALITRGLVNRIAEADALLDESVAAIDIARAREAMKYTRMDFERRRPKLYGPKQELSVDTQINVILRKDVTPYVVSDVGHNVTPSVSVREHKDNSDE